MSSAFGTFSIVGYDPATGDLGVAVASKFLAVGNSLRDLPEFKRLLQKYQSKQEE
jgi:hypothetical protein